MAVETRYAISGDVHIAYQVVGGGELDLLFVSSFLSNIELGWEHPAMSAFAMRLARFSRLILFDRRGDGMSDAAGRASTLEEQVDDVQAVLAAAGSSNPAVIAINEGAGLALLFAATHPEAVRALVLAAPVPRLVRGTGYEWAQSVEEREATIRGVIESWGRESPQNTWLDMSGPDPAMRAAMARYQRLAAGPGDAAATLMERSPCSTGRAAPSGARRRSARACASSGCRRGRVCTPASASCSATATSAASPCPSPPASPRSPRPTRCSPAAPSGT